jgi:dTDP-4-amino-4,6-dideoxygalactose transaminase
VKVNIFNLQRDHQEIKPDLVRIFEDVISGGEFILGAHVRALEEAFASYIGVKYAVGVGNGTDAVRIAGIALGLTPADKIITVPHTYVATTMALSAQGIMPVFCDISAETFNMDPQSLDNALNAHKDVKVCIPVHLYGHATPMDEIADVCARHGVRVMEDACQAHGALYKGKKVGSLGDVAAFSFYPTKNLGCFGDGGIVVTDSEEIYRNALKLRTFGEEGKHAHVTEGFNSRLDSIQAALLMRKLPLLDGWNERRRELARLYKEELRGVPVVLPEEAQWTRHVYHLFVIRSEKRDELRAYLADKGVTTLIHYPTAVHLQKVYSRLGYKAGSFPVAEKAIFEIITLPMYPSLQEEEVRYVAGVIKEFYGS